MKEIKLVYSAKNDISKAMAYYRETGSGEKQFKELITKRLDQLASYPLGLLPIKPDIKSTMLSTKRVEQNSFPYHIYYSSTDKYLIVLRVFHIRQNPNKAFDYSEF